MNRKRGIGTGIATALVLVLLSGCSLIGGNKTGSAIDPPQGRDAIADPAAETMAPAGDSEEGMTDAQGNMKATLFFADEYGNVAPLTIKIPKSESVARKSLEYMVDGGPVQDLLPQGFKALLPAGTEVIGIDIDQEQKLATVDFSKEFLNYDKQNERKILEAVTWTLTGFPTVQQVQIWVNGTLLKEMPVNKTPIDEPLTRAIGINVERADGVDFSKADAVTVYFLGRNQSNMQYYVPVTRLINRTDDLAVAAVNELISGPSSSDNLDAVMLPETKVLNVNKSDNLVTVDLDGTILSGADKAPAEALQSLVLSLTDSTGASEVQVMVNGSVLASGTDNRDYSKPVARPSELNPYPL